VVDETFVALHSNEFASAMKHSDNYFILITRASLDAVPYSISEIYSLESTEKYNEFNNAYTETVFKQLPDISNTVSKEDK
jgi:hypothetical protein